MSYSISKSGTIESVRKGLSDEYWGGRGARQAKALINHDLDILEEQGATHVVVSASGHEGSHNITVRRDGTAEDEHRKNEEGAAFDAWHAKGLQSGFIKESGEDKTLLAIPVRSKRNKSSSGPLAAEASSPKLH